MYTYVISKRARHQIRRNSYFCEDRKEMSDLASLLDHRHRTIFESITKYSTELSELGILPFETERLKTDHLGEREHKAKAPAGLFI